MEANERVLLEKYRPQDAELQTLWEEHLLYEKQLEKLESKPYLSPQEDTLVKDIKKKKLLGKTRMQAIIDRYKQQEG